MRNHALCGLHSKSLAQIIQTYAQTKELNKGKVLHARLLRIWYPVCTFLTNHLINMYSKCGVTHYALNLFEKMSQRNIVSWTAMITGFCQNLRFPEAVKAFSQMRISGNNPTEFAFASVIKACVSLRSISTGKQMHCLALKSGLDWNVYVGSNLADMYSKCGVMTDACKFFEEIPCKDAVLWTAMIDGYAKNGEFEEALLAFKRMIRDGIVIDPHVLSITLNACAAIKVRKSGECLHSSVVKLGFETKLVVGNALLDMYCKAGDMESASDVFDIVSEHKNVVSFTSLIHGYGEMDCIDEALDVFVDLSRQGIDPNEYTFSSLIKACANQAALEQGAQLQAQVIKLDFDSEPYISAGLVDMYGKCGLLDHSVQLFYEIINPSEIAWDALLNVSAQHGLGKEMMGTFDKMVLEVKPNAINFISLLAGCSRAGLVEEGLNYFYSMEKKYGVVPREEHYNCVIDLLGRAGRLKEAEEFINSMPFEPNAFGWCSFLGACTVHGDAERGKLAAERLIKHEPENSGALVLLSNLYAKEGKWEEVRSLRTLMRKGNMKKLPGYSWVDIGNKTHIFGSDDWSHPQRMEIYEKLDSLLDQIKEAGYVPSTASVPLDVNDSEKQQLLHHHSERIAIAFALISMPSGKPIVVKKNLRMGRVPVEIIGKGLDFTRPEIHWPLAEFIETDLVCSTAIAHKLVR
ncbi:DYW domain containing protein [Trema orientale]|uniref:DYW domain containing protein n=1 Tax=Trema orientale TaxID=63057 RepID=A0A2P5EC62_TREOI|nr:DYW domain containing protein [Trema orientale]